MLIKRWRVQFTERGRQWPSEPRPLLAELGHVDGWLAAEDIAERSPFLLAPDGSYDVVLNEYFDSYRMATASRHTHDASARDLARFLDFLWFHRLSITNAATSNGERPRTWRDATEDDRRAFEYWRCRDESGPLVAASTWDREVSSVNGFYRWAVRSGHIEHSPIVQRRARTHPRNRGLQRELETAAERRPDVGRDRVEWLPPRMYRAWRDVGLRGYRPDGLPDPTFRGARVARNAAYADTMVRIGLRLEEQSSLTIYELPDRDGFHGYYRSWLPASIAKLGSARNIYFPDSVLRDLWTYVEVDRAEAVARARAAGHYDRLADALIVDHPTRTAVRLDARWIGVDRLDPEQRSRLLRHTAEGLEPAALWLGRDGLPLTLHAWKSVFRAASDRCARSGLMIYCHPHMLRHSFAVTTLEHLQRGHLSVLDSMNPEQRRHYHMVFGDPLDWVRRRLGHRSVETTQIYLHTLAELEMETRMALVGDAWEDPRLLRAPDLALETEDTQNELAVASGSELGERSA
ncbi:tyrosine-type recombinase/integrase [Amycolatopsis keratiniphila]|uniref:tyrosine-type recombinase/integrase n=1 Tax=Amycolatopsis keratiniphila TaxID=129921 RepID=UPI00117FABAF|nr:site-specific integrase [Amycolatopsis keratiniphila]